MIVEPVRTGPAGPFRRLAGTLAVALPFVVLVGVVGVGIAGRASSDEEAARPALALASPAPVEPSPAPSADPGLARPVAFPDSTLGLPVVGVAEILAAREARTAVGVVAVAGYLSLRPGSATCSAPPPPLARLDATCDRFGFLADMPESPYLDQAGAPRWRGPHLHPQFPPGTRIPEQAAVDASDPSAPPPAVVVLGRFDDPRANPCRPGSRHCGEEFVVERVAWVDGQPWRRTLSFDPKLDADLREAAWEQRRSILGSAAPAGRVLGAAFLAPATLADFHPVAAEALPADPPESIWLLRVLDVRPGDATAEPAAGAKSAATIGGVVWLVLDGSTGRVLARGED